MADETTTTLEAETADADDEVVKTVAAINKKLDSMEEQIKKAAEARRDPGFSIRTGEDALTSRPFSLMRLAKAMLETGGRAAFDSVGADSIAKVELDLNSRMRKHWNPQNSQAVLVPLGAALLPQDDRKDAKGATHPGFPAELIKECRDLMVGGTGNSMDLEQLNWISKRNGWDWLQKDLSAFAGTTGGTLVPLSPQGELIDLLRPVGVFGRAGSQQVPLPPSGSIRFPKDNSDPVFYGLAEGATGTESTPDTGELVLTAKKYMSLVDASLEALRYPSVAMEGWLRRKMTFEAALKADRDMINGLSGTTIKGIVSYNGINTVLATTVASNGNTLGADDISIGIANLANQNARMESGVFVALRPLLWQKITHRRAGSGFAADDGTGPYLFNFPRGMEGLPDAIEGARVITSTNVPRTRAKGTGTTLTLVLVGVGSSWITGISGVMEFDMTTANDVNFTKGINTFRGVMYIDAGPEHEEEFTLIDTLLETT